MSEVDQRELVSDLLRGAIPVNPSPTSRYVTSEEFAATVALLDAKIENSSLKMRNWILGGVLAIIVALAGSYISLIAQIDRITQALPGIVEVQDGRREWIQKQDQRDSQQDAALRKLDPNYQSLPYEASPR